MLHYYGGPRGMDVAPVRVPGSTADGGLHTVRHAEQASGHNDSTPERIRTAHPEMDQSSERFPTETESLAGRICKHGNGSGGFQTLGEAPSSAGQPAVWLHGVR